MEKATEHNKQWKKVKLGDLISDSYAGGTPNRARNDYFGGDIPWVSSGEVNNPIIDSTIENITQVGLNNSSARWIPENSILLALYGATAGQVSMLKIRATANQAVLAIIPNNEVVDTQFLFYQIFHNKQSLLFLAQGSGQPNLSKSIVDRLDISYPDSLPAQRRIAAILSTADKVIEQTRQLIGKYKSIKQGMMEDLLKPKEGWKKVRLGECLTIGNGQDYKHLQSGEIPVYGTGGVMTYVDDYLYEGETVCIGRKGTINKPIFHVGKIWTVDTLFYTHSFIDVSPLFIYYVFCNIDWNKYNEATGVPSLSKETIYKIEIPVPFKENKPDLTEQYRIASILSGIDAKIAAEEKVLEKYEKVKRGLMERLLNEQCTMNNVQ